MTTTAADKTLCVEFPEDDRIVKGRAVTEYSFSQLHDAK